jgi:hypothetical protein
MKPSANIPPVPSSLGGEKGMVRLPILIFLFTLDQMAGMLNMPLADFKVKHVYFHMRNTGRKLPHQMTARNIAPDGDTADWRIAHEEFRRWLLANGYRVHYGGAG